MSAPRTVEINGIHYDRRDLSKLVASVESVNGFLVGLLGGVAFAQLLDVFGAAANLVLLLTVALTLIFVHLNTRRLS